MFHKKTAPYIFGYSSYNNGPIFVKFAANLRWRMQILLTLDFVEYMINILCNEQSNQHLRIQCWTSCNAVYAI